MVGTTTMVGVESASMAASAITVFPLPVGSSRTPRSLASRHAESASSW